MSTYKQQHNDWSKVTILSKTQVNIAPLITKDPMKTVHTVHNPMKLFFRVSHTCNACNDSMEST